MKTISKRRKTITKPSQGISATPRSSLLPSLLPRSPWIATTVRSPALLWWLIPLMKSHRKPQINYGRILNLSSRDPCTWAKFKGLNSRRTFLKTLATCLHSRGAFSNHRLAERGEALNRPKKLVPWGALPWKKVQKLSSNMELAFPHCWIRITSQTTQTIR